MQHPLAEPLHDITGLPSPLTGDSFVTYIDEDPDAPGNILCREHDPAFDSDTFNILIGRGCIGSCAYCAAPVLRRRYAEEGHRMPKYRRRSYEQVLHELEEAKRHGCRRVFIKDEYLVDTADRLKAFFIQYRERINLPFRANLHPDQLLDNPDLLDAALAAGFDGFTIGFEAGNEDFARRIYHRQHGFSRLKDLTRKLFDTFVFLQYHFVSGTNLNTEEEFRTKCALIADLPYDYLFPWRAVVMDFQFYPQPGSEITRRLGDGGIRRLPVREWAVLALRAQLRQFAGEDICRAIEDSSKNSKDPVEYFLEARAALAKEARITSLTRLKQHIAGRDILVCGEALPEFSRNAELTVQSRVVGRIAFPGHAATGGRIDAKRVSDTYGDAVPILMFGSAVHRFALMFRRRYNLKNPIYTIVDP